MTSLVDVSRVVERPAMVGGSGGVWSVCWRRSQWTQTQVSGVPGRHVQTLLLSYTESSYKSRQPKSGPAPFASFEDLSDFLGGWGVDISWLLTSVYRGHVTWGDRPFARHSWGGGLRPGKTPGQCVHPAEQGGREGAAPEEQGPLSNLRIRGGRVYSRPEVSLRALSFLEIKILSSRSTAEEADYQLQITRDASHSTYRWLQPQWYKISPNSIVTCRRAPASTGGSSHSSHGTYNFRMIDASRESLMDLDRRHHTMEANREGPRSVTWTLEAVIYICKNVLFQSQ